MFSQRLIVGAAWLLSLGTGASANAQSTAEAPSTALAAAEPDAALRSARYTAAHDSALAKAAAYRAETEGRLRSFNASFTGIAGLRHRIKSYNSAGPIGGRAMLKRHVIKHKTTGAKVEKIDYRAPDGTPMLLERYVQGQLVRLEVFEYAPSKNVSRLKESGSWLLVPGDYLRRTRNRPGKATTRTYYFHTPPTALK